MSLGVIMDANRFSCLMLGVWACLLAPGCASVVSGRRADVAINSTPSNAVVSVRDNQGSEVAVVRTPAVVSLKRGAGFLKPACYTATIEKPGYRLAQVDISPRLNPWLLGNVVIGGVPGLILDPYTGAMWNLTPSEIASNLTPTALADAEDQKHDDGAYQARQVQPASAEQPSRR